MELQQLFEGDPCEACLGTGQRVNRAAVKRLVASLVVRLGHDEVLKVVGVADSTLRSLLNGTREWQGDQVKRLMEASARGGVL